MAEALIYRDVFRVGFIALGTYLVILARLGGLVRSGIFTVVALVIRRY